MHYYPKCITTHNTILKNITHMHPPNWYAQVSKSRGGRGGIDITHTPPHKTDVIKAPSQEVGVLTLHIQLPNWCAQVSKSWGGGYWHYTYPPKLKWSSVHVKRWGVLILHIPPTKLMCLSLCQEVGILTLLILILKLITNSKLKPKNITHEYSNWCAQVSKAPRFYTYPPH